MNGFIVIGSATVGVLVGLTGAGGGALMTPMLILLFSVKPSAAISSDLVAALVMRPVGAAVHFQRRTVNFALVGWLSAGSVPAALAGAYLLHLLGHTKSATADIEMALGVALLLGSAAMVLRLLLDRHSGQDRDASLASIQTRPAVTVAIGVIGGVIVGATSVGAGSLMIVLLLFAYPAIAAGQLVGTDLAQAIPLTGSAALGALLFGHVEVPLTASIVIGAVPGVLVGSLLSSRISDRKLRPVVFCVILASGLKYVGAGNLVLGAVVGSVVVILVARSLAGRLRRPGRGAHSAQRNSAPIPSCGPPPEGTTRAVARRSSFGSSWTSRAVTRVWRRNSDVGPTPSTARSPSPLAGMLDPPRPGWQARPDGTLRTRPGDPRVRRFLVDRPGPQARSHQGAPRAVGQPLPSDPHVADRLR